MTAAPYKRMFHRWEILRGWLPAIIFAAVAAAIELFFLAYDTGRGLADMSFNISIFSLKIPLSIALFLSLGNAVVALVLWMTVFENTAYVAAGPDRQVRRALYPLRMLKAAALILSPFTLFLFLPYVVGSGWYIGFVSSSPSQSTINFYSWAYWVGQTSASDRFVASQMLAALASTIVASLQIWRVKGTRNLVLLLRRKR